MRVALIKMPIFAVLVNVNYEKIFTVLCWRSRSYAECANTPAIAAIHAGVVEENLCAFARPFARGG